MQGTGRIQGAEDPAVVTMPLNRLRRRRATEPPVGMPPTVPLEPATDAQSAVTTTHIGGEGPWAQMTDDNDPEFVRPLGRRVLGVIEATPRLGRPAGRDTEAPQSIATGTTVDITVATAPALSTTVTEDGEGGDPEHQQTSIASWIVPLGLDGTREAATMETGVLAAGQVPMRMATGLEQRADVHTEAEAIAPKASATQQLHPFIRPDTLFTEPPRPIASQSAPAQSCQVILSPPDAKAN